MQTNTQTNTHNSYSYIPRDGLRHWHPFSINLNFVQLCKKLFLQTLLQTMSITMGTINKTLHWLPWEHILVGCTSDAKCSRKALLECLNKLIPFFIRYKLLFLYTLVMPTDAMTAILYLHACNYNLVIFFKERIILNYLLVNCSLCILARVLSLSFLNYRTYNRIIVVCVIKNEPWTLR